MSISRRGVRRAGREERSRGERRTRKHRGSKEEARTRAGEAYRRGPHLIGRPEGGVQVVRVWARIGARTPVARHWGYIGEEMSGGEDRRGEGDETRREGRRGKKQCLRLQCARHLTRGGHSGELRGPGVLPVHAPARRQL